MDLNQIQTELGKRRKHKVLYIILSVLVVIIGGTVGFGIIEYHALQPKDHFQDIPVVSGKVSSVSKQKLQKTKSQQGVFNLLLLGSDMKSAKDTVGHSDSIVLVHVDLNHHTYHILSIPRDTRVYMPGYGYTKLTSVQYMDQTQNGEQQGIVNSVTAISQLTGVPINYYAEVNSWGLRDIVNSIGGIDMYIPFTLTINSARFPNDDGKVFTKGMHIVDGNTSADLVHVRHGLPGGDYGRQRLQAEALIAIAKAMLKPENITKLPAIMSTIPKFLMATNMSKEDMLSFGLGIRGNFHPDSQIVYEQVPGKEEVTYDDILKANNDEIVIDEAELQKIVSTFFSN